MFEALERLPREELALRWRACRRFLASDAPRAGGLFAFSKMNIYYLTGCLVAGVCWLPADDADAEPVLFVRRGAERAALESPLAHIVTFRSYRDLVDLAAQAGAPLPDVIAAEMSGLPWNLAAGLTKHLGANRFVPGDAVLAKARSLKTPWEMAKMRLCGKRHEQALREVLPAKLRPGMTEREVSHATWEAFFELGHMGMMRMGAFGEEIFLGHVSAGDSGNYPSAFDGPLGLRGEHPAIPFMGYAGKVWQPGEPLTVDVGFALEGYNTDKTQVYFAGKLADLPADLARAHEGCIRVQEYAAARLKPGQIPSEIYAGALELAQELGMGEGFMALPPNTVSFIGHGIGLTIDGFPVIAKGFDEPLELGQVLALEPKCGVPGKGMAGVENTFEVTPQGGVCLTGQDYEMICIE